jgi:hypothetical protein
MLQEKVREDGVSLWYDKLLHQYWTPQPNMDMETVCEIIYLVQGWPE